MQQHTLRLPSDVRHLVREAARDVGGALLQYRIETIGASSSPYLCNRFTGDGCTLIPNTDDGTPAAFYPFFSIRNAGGQCVWQIGNHIPGSKNDFGQNQQYGTLLNLTYTEVGGGQSTRYNDFRMILSKNPC